MKKNFNKNTDERVERLLKDLNQVGEKKLLGYLPLGTIRDICGEDPVALQKQAEARGLKTLLLSSRECDVASGALYVYDSEKLQKFILVPQNKEILERNNWPTDVDGFVKNITCVLASDEPLYDLIALCFNDPRPCYQDYKGTGPKSPQPWRP